MAEQTREQAYHEPAREVPVVGEYDVVVVGAGPAGLGAAVGAAQAGASALILDQHGFPGGMLTAGLVGPVGAWRCAQGVYEQLVQRATARGGCLNRHVFDPEVFKVAAIELLEDSGVAMRFHHFFAAPMMDGNRVAGVITESKSGRRAFAGKLVVDCTGDADVAYRAGAACWHGRAKDGLTQTVTLMFRLAGVDLEKLVDYAHENPDDFYPSYHHSREGLEEKGHAGYWVNGYRGLIKELREKWSLDPVSTGLLMFGMTRPDEVQVNTISARYIDGSNADQLSEGEIYTRKRVFDLVDLFREKAAGFENVRLMDTAPHLGIRETRRVQGAKVLDARDALKGLRPPDTVALGDYNIDVHCIDEEEMKEFRQHSGRPERPYGIPYGCLVPESVDGLLVAGRCISTDRWANGSIRVMGTCAATGHAAGVAAALAIRDGVQPRALPPGQVREELRRQDADLGDAKD